MERSNDWDSVGDELRTALRAVLASLMPSIDTLDTNAGRYQRAQMIEALIMLEQVATRCEGYAEAHRLYSR